MKLSGSESRPQTIPARGTLLKKLIALVAMMLMIGGANAALAGPPEGKGPGDNNKHGLCTAYFNGQKKGHDKHGDPGPFQGIEDAAEEHADPNDEDDTPATMEEIVAYCNQFGIGGNPAHGRYPDCFDTNEDGAPNEDTECDYPADPPTE